MTEQRVALVTGAGRGIGIAVVRRLAADGWAVIAVDRCADDPDVPYPLAHPRRLAELAESLPAVRAVQADVRDRAALSHAVELAEQEFVGRLLEPDEIARVVAWACSPAAGALTGSVLHADGGFTG